MIPTESARPMILRLGSAKDLPKKSDFSERLLIGTLKEQIKPLVLEEHEFEVRDKSIIMQKEQLPSGRLEPNWFQQ